MEPMRVRMRKGLVAMTFALELLASLEKPCASWEDLALTGLVLGVSTAVAASLTACSITARTLSLLPDPQGSEGKTYVHKTADMANGDELRANPLSSPFLEVTMPKKASSFVITLRLASTPPKPNPTATEVPSLPSAPVSVKLVRSRGADVRATGSGALPFVLLSTELTRPA